MNILGISAYYHDSAATLVQDGGITAAALEERFTRRKHDAGFPAHAVNYCLGEAGITADALDAVAFYEKPLIKAERLMETYLANAPRGFRSFAAAIPAWLRDKSRIPAAIRKGLGGHYQGPILFPEHHESHAASAFFPSPFDDAAILTADGVGEWATTTIGIGEDNRIQLLREVRFPHSLGLLYSAFTYYLGFRVNSGEYKVMGLAPYGKPTYVGQIYEHLLRVNEDGSFWLNQDYFDYCTGLAMTNERFHRLFGGPPRAPESALTQKEMDLAASVQSVTEEVMLRLAWTASEITRKPRLCLAGGVALNCVANGRILREGPFREIWIQPAAGDAGGSLGAALFVWHQVLDRPRENEGRDCMRGAFLGPSYPDAAVGEFTRSVDEDALWVPDEELAARVAAMIDEGKVVGWFRGRMEFGPRALGARSILGDARNPRMQSLMNRKIKFRESFRPFAPCVLREHAARYFGLHCESPYMLLVSPVAAEFRQPEPDDHGGGQGVERLHAVRSTIPAVTHVDYSARIQTVDAERHGLLHTMLQRFFERTGCPLIVNTSFNVRSEPIVCTPADAYRCFQHTGMDALVLGNHLLWKRGRPAEEDTSEYLSQFHLD